MPTHRTGLTSTGNSMSHNEPFLGQGESPTAILLLDNGTYMLLNDEHAPIYDGWIYVIDSSLDSVRGVTVLDLNVDSSTSLRSLRVARPWPHRGDLEARLLEIAAFTPYVVQIARVKRTVFAIVLDCPWHPRIYLQRVEASGAIWTAQFGRAMRFTKPHLDNYLESFASTPWQHFGPDLHHLRHVGTREPIDWLCVPAWTVGDETKNLDTQTDPGKTTLERRIELD